MTQLLRLVVIALMFAGTITAPAAEAKVRIVFFTPKDVAPPPNVGHRMKQAIAEHKIPRQGSTWWIFVYGTKLKASHGYGGFGDVKGNGWALLVWCEVPGELTMETPLAGGIAGRVNLKGYLHELGHTMNLAHFGPLDRDSRTDGMSLMGPRSDESRPAQGRRRDSRGFPGCWKYQEPDRSAESSRLTTGCSSLLRWCRAY